MHRDIKPPNVLCDAHGRCKLGDFGTAVALSGSEARLTECIGTALYMAPEVEAASPYGCASDVFSFGAMAFEVFYLLDTGEDFYDDMNLFTGLEVLRTPLTSTPQEMPERPSACDDDEVWACLCACMSADPEQRPTAAAAAATLSARSDVGEWRGQRWRGAGARAATEWLAGRD